MFETSIVRARAAAAPRRIGLLTASLAFHSLVVVAAVVMTVRSVDFPPKAPNEMEIFRPIPVVSLPPALGTPRAATPRPPAPAQPQPAQRTAPPVAAITAPPVVPDTITPAAAQTTTGDPSASATATAPGDGAIVRPDGVPGGFGDGDTSLVAAPGGVLVPGGEVQSAVVLQRVEPRYPQVAVAARKDGTVVVRCIIGKDGTCRDPQIVMSTFGAFNQPAIDAVTQWRFAPGSYRGQVVDTYFELTIRFKLN